MPGGLAPETQSMKSLGRNLFGLVHLIARRRSGSQLNMTVQHNHVGRNLKNIPANGARSIQSKTFDSLRNPQEVKPRTSSLRMRPASSRFGARFLRCNATVAIVRLIQYGFSKHFLADGR